MIKNILIVILLFLSVGLAHADSIQSTVISSSDDAEQRLSGQMTLTSTDLELVTDGTNVQEVGMRFTNVQIPPGAQITSASIQFTVDEVTTRQQM